MQLHPAHFNGVYSNTYFPFTDCSDAFYQYGWQDGGKVAREDLARAIGDAEQIIAGYVGYNLLPDWVCEEHRMVTRPYRPELFSIDGLNVRGQSKTITTNRAHFISGGAKAKTLIEAGVSGVASDADGDGYAETLTFTVASDVDPCEVHAYHYNQGGADDYEIRPIVVTNVGGGNYTVVIKIWQIPDLNLWESLSATGIDGDTATNFQQCTGPNYCIDLYRVYNDPSEQAQFHWLDPSCSTCGGAGCTACQFGTQDGCLHAKEYRLGIVAYSPGVWDADTETWTADSWAECREPDRVKIWYYSGWRWNCATCPETQMDPYWERAVAYFATALLERPLCGCDCNVARLDHWREDLALNNTARTFQNAPRVLENPFGTTRGAVYAWNACNADGRKIAR